MGQLSFFSAEARSPCVADLAGLLCGPGRAVGFARGRAARISVPLDERWRGLALVAALAERGVHARLDAVERPAGPADPDGAADPADEQDGRDGQDERGEPPDPAPEEPDITDQTDEVVEDEAEPGGVVFGRPRPGRAGDDPGARALPPARRGLEVATAFRTDLTGLAGQWLAGGAKVVPPGFTPHGGVLRLWALASGRWAESAYVLGLDPAAPATHEPLQKALAASGLPATLLGSGGPALRVVGRRRLERLAELVGRAPRGVVERTWPAA
ncbi:hypothetical protein [Saccharothrix algeriensis]|uniref:Uncharacterized protein n=1 Tax=Saccharothrix algeriensis TaxID=173560 RepID=A0ABS2S6K7_9PSEU|nr:hypothetical protein [Saccharothrix algeriensis]MBM7811867.1 hypothetical protein [Saccharothrix algeriensis]